MVNDLFNVEVAETTVVLRKLLRCHVLRLTEGEDSVAAITYWRLPPNGPGLETSITTFLSERRWNIDGFLNGLYKGCLLHSKDPECAARDIEKESSSGRDRKDSGLSQHFLTELGVFNENFWSLSGHPGSWRLQVPWWELRGEKLSDKRFLFFCFSFFSEVGGVRVE